MNGSHLIRLLSVQKLYNMNILRSQPYVLPVYSTKEWMSLEVFHMGDSMVGVTAQSEKKSYTIFMIHLIV